MLSELFDHIDGRRDEYIDRLRRWVAVPSISSTGEGMDRAPAAAAGLLGELGFAARPLDAGAGWPAVFGDRPADRPGPTVLLYGHYDVQPPGDPAEWTSPPFQAEVRDGRIYGRGTADNKGQHLAALLAVDAVARVTGGVGCHVKVLLDGEEEICSPHLAAIAEAHRELLTADLAIWADGPVHESGRWALVFGVRGALTFEVEASGAASDLHSGNWGGVAPNAAWRLVHALGSLRDADGRILVDGWDDTVPELGELERATLAEHEPDPAALLAGIGADALDGPPGRSIGDRLAAYPTLSVNGLSSGHTGPGIRTVIPHRAVARCDIRLVPGQRAGTVWPLIRDHLQRQPGITARLLMSAEASGTPMDSPWTAPIAAGMRDAQGEPPVLLPPQGGTLPISPLTDELGLPTFGVPCANVDENNHAPDENLDLDRFLTGVKSIAAILLRLEAYSPPSGSREPTNDW
ncbi:M20/M25/M40 family metallo-hydrolase [Amycolatopsis suaedae]|uniref:M20/M25/M40 family metallo-hydrolase n=1 Tax=Amycolatopsis suaedae TaxID=2510978 RepID=A0A4Q7J2H2_9PSEU|nr:M20/M25/M40 family metallo-hydrolase [Amycolatopsis suaedae]RZQ60948.1 M20/M25/M40 family metallo-hydrolase [Amycolatopsis suaedae]